MVARLVYVDSYTQKSPKEVYFLFPMPGEQEPDMETRRKYLSEIFSGIQVAFEQSGMGVEAIDPRSNDVSLGLRVTTPIRATLTPVEGELRTRPIRDTMGKVVQYGLEVVLQRENQMYYDNGGW